MILFAIYPKVTTTIVGAPKWRWYCDFKMCLKLWMMLFQGLQKMKSLCWSNIEEVTTLGYSWESVYWWWQALCCQYDMLEMSKQESNEILWSNYHWGDKDREGFQNKFGGSLEAGELRVKQRSSEEVTKQVNQAKGHKKVNGDEGR